MPRLVFISCGYHFYGTAENSDYRQSTRLSENIPRVAMNFDRDFVCIGINDWGFNVNYTTRFEFPYIDVENIQFRTPKCVLDGSHFPIFWGCGPY